jgi:rare lipoprotein A
VRDQRGPETLRLATSVMPLRSVVARMGHAACFVAGASLGMTVLYVAGCARNEPPSARFGRNVSASARLEPGQSMRRGGGHYKLGVPYKIDGRWYVPRNDPSYDRTGIASWYGDDFHARLTANGEVYDMWTLSAAHPTLPLPSYVYVTNLANNRTILVRVNDRGPFVADRLIDLSRTSARALDLEHKGLAHVRVRYAGPAPLDGSTSREVAFLRGQGWYAESVAQTSSGRRALGGPPSSK